MEVPECNHPRSTSLPQVKARRLRAVHLRASTDMLQHHLNSHTHLGVRQSGFSPAVSQPEVFFLSARPGTSDTLSLAFNAMGPQATPHLTTIVTCRVCMSSSSHTHWNWANIAHSNTETARITLRVCRKQADRANLSSDFFLRCGSETKYNVRGDSVIILSGLQRNLLYQSFVSQSLWFSCGCRWAPADRVIRTCYRRCNLISFLASLFPGVWIHGIHDYQPNHFKCTIVGETVKVNRLIFQSRTLILCSLHYLLDAVLKTVTTLEALTLNYFHILMRRC
jgi:hypothetical protein